MALLGQWPPSAPRGAQHNSHHPQSPWQYGCGRSKLGPAGECRCTPAPEGLAHFSPISICGNHVQSTKASEWNCRVRPNPLAGAKSDVSRYFHWEEDWLPSQFNLLTCFHGNKSSKGKCWKRNILLLSHHFSTEKKMLVFVLCFSYEILFIW